MVSVNPTRDSLYIMLAEKKAEARGWESRLGTLQEDIRAIERVLGMYPNGTAETSVPSPTVQVTASELRNGHTHKEAVDYIADKHGGRVKVGEAKHLLIEAGLVTGNPKYVYGHIYNMLKNDERYEPVGKGEFQKKQGSLALR